MFNQFKGVFFLGNIVKTSKLKLILYNPYRIQNNCYFKKTKLIIIPTKKRSCFQWITELLRRMYVFRNINKKSLN